MVQNGTTRLIWFDDRATVLNSLLSSPTSNFSDKYAFESFHTYILNHSSIRRRRQLKVESNFPKYNMMGHWQWRGGRVGGWWYSLQNAVIGQQSNVNSKNIISDAKYCFLCVKKAGRTWGKGWDGWMIGGRGDSGQVGDRCGRNVFA